MTRRGCGFTETLLTIRPGTYNLWRYDLDARRLIWAKPGTSAATSGSTTHDGEKFFDNSAGNHYSYFEPFTGNRVPLVGDLTGSPGPGTIGTFYSPRDSGRTDTAIGNRYYGLNWIRKPVMHNVVSSVHYISYPPSYNMTSSTAMANTFCCAANNSGGLVWVKLVSPGVRQFIHTDQFGAITEQWSSPSTASGTTNFRDVLRSGWAVSLNGSNHDYYLNNGAGSTFLFSLSSSASIAATPSYHWQVSGSNLWVKTGNAVGTSDIILYSGYTGGEIVHLYSDDTVLVRFSGGANRSRFDRVNVSGSLVERIYAVNILCIQDGTVVLIDPHPSSATASRQVNLISLRSGLNGSDFDQIDEFVLGGTALEGMAAYVSSKYLDVARVITV